MYIRNLPVQRNEGGRSRQKAQIIHSLEAESLHSVLLTSFHTISIKIRAIYNIN